MIHFCLDKETMRIFCNNQLNNTQIAAVERLAEDCTIVDGGLPIIYWDLLAEQRATDNNIMAFQGERLVGFLSAYFFYEKACEISLMVAPDYRRQGLARNLLRAIIPLLVGKQVDSLILSSPAITTKPWQTKVGFFYRSSEYIMERNSYEPIFLAKDTLSVRIATVDDIPQLCKVDATCFSNHLELNSPFCTAYPFEMAARFDSLLTDTHYTILLAHLAQAPVGKAHIRWHEKGANFSDIAILPSYQGQGLGSQLLIYSIHHALTKGKIKLTLTVETSNQQALDLYTRYGFKVKNVYDYWTISLDKLRSLL